MPKKPREPDGSQKCECRSDRFINVRKGRRCESCADIIPGCGECEQTDYPRPGQTRINIGYDKLIANGKKGSFLICKRCAKDTMFEVTI